MQGSQVSNSGGAGVTILARQGSELRLYSSSIRGGESAGIQLCNSNLLAVHATISDNNGAGLLLAEGSAFLEDSYIQRNNGPAISMTQRLEVLNTPGGSICILRSPSLAIKINLTLGHPTSAMNAQTKNWLALSYCDVHSNMQGFLGDSVTDLDTNETITGVKPPDSSSSVINEIYVRKSVGDAQTVTAFGSYRWPVKSPRHSRSSLASQNQEKSECLDMDVDQGSVIDVDDEAQSLVEEHSDGSKRGRMSNSTSENDWLIGDETSARLSPRVED